MPRAVPGRGKGMPGSETVLIASALVCGLVLARWMAGQRQARRLCRQQESPQVDASFDVLPAIGTGGHVVLSRPAPWKRHWWGVSVPRQETWYCLVDGTGCLAITAHYRRVAWGWRVHWAVQVLSAQDSGSGVLHHEALDRRSLTDDPQYA